MSNPYQYKKVLPKAYAGGYQRDDVIPILRKTFVNLSQLLVPKAVLIQDDAVDSSTIIRRLGELLNQQGYVTDGFIDATLQREANMPTGLPLGGEYNAAMPHVDLEYVYKPAVALATLKNPVIFHHMVMTEEEVPVRLVIMLALDKPKSQIEVLQQVAEVLQKPEIVAGLISAKNPEDVIAIMKEMEQVA
jgi:galactitol PTS system EIIA component